MSALDPSVRQRLIDAVGPANAVTDPEAIAPYLQEWRGLYHGRSSLVLKPQDTAEVSTILRVCNETRTPVVPQGGNTGLVGGQIALGAGDEVVLSLSRMIRIRRMSQSARIITVEAGATVHAVQTVADDAGLLYPLSLASEGSCQVGGTLSTNAGGIGALAYGVARDLCNGLEVVLANGDVLNRLSDLKKDNRGYDLKNLFIGAEGTLGVITAASLKLFPKPSGRAVAWVTIPTVEDALRLYRDLSGQLGSDLVAFELCGHRAMAFTFRHFPSLRPPVSEMAEWYAMIECISANDQNEADQKLQSALERALAEGTIVDASIGRSEQQRREFRAVREHMSESQKPEGASIKHDVSLPVDVIPAFIHDAEDQLMARFPGIRIVCFGHLGDGNLHYNVSQPVGADREQFLGLWDDVNDVVHGLVAGFGGSFSAEHGIGALKRDLLARTSDPVALGLMRQLKTALDPNGILNPGKVL